MNEITHDLCTACAVAVMYDDPSALTEAQNDLVDTFCSDTGRLAYVGPVLLDRCDCCGRESGEQFDGQRLEEIPAAPEE